jgi:hypothetical protein
MPTSHPVALIVVPASVDVDPVTTLTAVRPVDPARTHVAAPAGASPSATAPTPASVTTGSPASTTALPISGRTLRFPRNRMLQPSSLIASLLQGESVRPRSVRGQREGKPAEPFLVELRSPLPLTTRLPIAI